MARLPLSRHDLSQPWSRLFRRRRRPPAAHSSGKQQWGKVPSRPRPKLLNMRPLPSPLPQRVPLQHRTMVHSMQPVRRAPHEQAGHGPATPEQV